MATILVVDDSKLSRSISAKALSEAGHTVLEAADGEEGLAIFLQQRPDCVVTDLLMPVLDGHAMLGQIRLASPEVPVIVLTADIQSSTRSMCQQLGIDAFINKPIHADTLRRCVQQALSRTQGAPSCS